MTLDTVAAINNQSFACENRLNSVKTFLGRATPLEKMIVMRALEESLNEIEGFMDDVTTVRNSSGN
jgi:hypothetical protein